MYIKIERGDKTQMHHAKSYYTNQCGDGLDLNIERVDGERFGIRIEKGDKTKMFVMNDNGKTIDRI
jgi:hypothetical protein